MSTIPRSLLRLALLSFLLLVTSASAWATVNIPVMTWTQRSDWFNVVTGYGADPTGAHDSTTAIQNAINAAVNTTTGACKTVYFPAGTYAISGTLTWPLTTYGIAGGAMIGCGSNTTIKWTGAAGLPMFFTQGASETRYIGMIWDGQNTAACAFEADSSYLYEWSTRFENDAFLNFTHANNSYSGESGIPAAAIISGLTISDTGSPDSETMVWNCLFSNCSNGVVVGHDEANDYLWEIKGCEFDNCGIGILNEIGQFTALECHFQGSTVCDIQSNAGMRPRIRRCTSVGSKMFFYSQAGNFFTGNQLIQDCRIDSWTNSAGAIQNGNVGPTEVLDCVFTNPPAGGSGNPNNSPIVMTNTSQYPGLMTVSNNYCPTVSAANLVNLGPNPVGNLVTISVGAVPGTIATLSSANTTFLQTAEQDDSAHILDVTLPPYSAKNDNSIDATSAIQAAITQAKTNNNGSIVYLPYGTFKVSSTLNVTGSNYTIQGSGIGSHLMWNGPDGGIFVNVTTPHGIAMQQLEFRYQCPPAGIYTNVTAINQTATAACDIKYDGIYYNKDITPQTASGTGLVMTNLPTNSRVYINHSAIPFTFSDCGPAQILANYALGGRIIIGGATNPKTGFLGILNTENGSNLNPGPSTWDIQVNDNQDVVIGDYYSEQSYNHLQCSRGAGTGTGRVTIGGIKQNFNLDPVPNPYDAIDIENYAGRVYYGQVQWSNGSYNTNTGVYTYVPTNIVQHGANACSLILDSTTFDYTTYQNATFGSGLNFIRLNSLISQQFFYGNDEPTGWGATTAMALDDEKQLGALDLNWNYGVIEAITNNGFEADTPNPNPTTVMGDLPAGWTESSYSGTGVRQATVVAGTATSPASPFAAANGYGQCVRYLDNTGSSAGTPLSFVQNFTALPVTDGAVLTVDFQYNPMTTLHDSTYLRVYTGDNATAILLNIRYTGSGGTITSTVGGHVNTTVASGLVAGQWYRLQAAINAPSAGVPSNGTTNGQCFVTLTPWGQTPTSFWVDGLQSPAAKGFASIKFNNDNAGEATDLSFDNITLLTGDPLLSSLGSQNGN